MATYIALLRKDEDSDFGVDFPEFPGCITAGKTLEEARRRASEALKLHIRCDRR
jgi:predicted RNase H-like HicB family nuclease